MPEPILSETVSASPLLWIVEDHRALRELLATRARSSGRFRGVWAAGDGAEAAERWQRVAESDRPNLLIAGLYLPELNAIELVRRMRRDPAGRELTAVVLSEEDEPLERAAARREGCAGYFFKPRTAAAADQLLAVAAGLVRRRVAAPHPFARAAVVAAVVRSHAVAP